MHGFGGYQPQPFKWPNMNAPEMKLSHVNSVGNALNNSVQATMNNSVTRALNAPLGHVNEPRQNSFYLNDGGDHQPIIKRQSTRGRNISKDTNLSTNIVDKQFQAMFGQRQTVTSEYAKPKVAPIKLDIPKDAMTGETPTSLENHNHKLTGQHHPLTIDRGLGSLISRPGNLRGSTKVGAASIKSNPKDSNKITNRVSSSKTNNSRISEKRLAKRTQKELDKIDRLALAPTKIPKMVLDNDASFDSENSVKKAKRGRKTMGADKYVQESEDKINGWKKTLKDGKYPNGKILTEDDIAKLKNQISAQRSRANKKMEVKAL